MRRKFLYIRLIILSLVLVAIFLPGLSRLQELREKNAKLEKEIEELKESGRRLIEERQRLENDPVYVEGIARERLGLIGEGEIVYKITK